MTLIGTKGCINYNPVLAQMQFEYPIKRAPTSFVSQPFLFLYEDGFAAEVLPQVRRACEDVIPWKETLNHVP